MKNRTKIPAAIGLAIAASLTLTACNDAGATEALAQSQAELAAAHATLDAYNAVLAEAQAQEAAEAAEAEAARQANAVNVEEIPLFTLENTWFSHEGEMIFEQVDAQSLSIADFANVNSVPWWFGSGLFFLNDNLIEPFDADAWIAEHGANVGMPIGDFILELNLEQFEDGGFDAVNNYIRTYEDLSNGIPVEVSFSDFPVIGFHLIEPLDVGERAISLLNDDDTIDLQFRFDNTLELVEAVIVDNDFGGLVEIRVNQGSPTNQDAAWRLSSSTQELPTMIRIIDAKSEQVLGSVRVGENLPLLLETRLIPELIEAARQFAIQRGLSW